MIHYHRVYLLVFVSYGITGMEGMNKGGYSRNTSRMENSKKSLPYNRVMWPTVCIRPLGQYTQNA